jgi:hypothetical protein
VLVPDTFNYSFKSSRRRKGRRYVSNVRGGGNQNIVPNYYDLIFAVGLTKDHMKEHELFILTLLFITNIIN